MSVKVHIVDYGAGNLRNVQKAVEILGYQAVICREADELKSAGAIVLPGVGAFKDGMESLKKFRLDIALRDAVLQRKVPILGICLGMQLLAEAGHEGSYAKGLEMLPMVVEKMRSEEKGLRLPHIGWNDVAAKQGSVLFDSIPSSPDFYFVHGFHAVCKDDSIVAATAEYGFRFVAAVERGNIFGTQFHPEKSQRYGLKLLKNFLLFASGGGRGGSPC